MTALRRIGSSGAVLLVVLVAAGATLAVTSGKVSSGSASTPCDADGVTLTQNLSGSNVTTVTVAGIAAACGSGTVSVTVNNGTTSQSGGPTAIPSGGGSVTVTLGTAIALKDSHYVNVVLKGP